MCRDSATAEDIMQECFLRAILSLPDGHGNMRAWLYRVARNLLLDQLRGRRREADAMPEPPAGTEEEPLSVYLRSEKRRRLIELMAGLDERRREILTLHYYSGLSQKEIAALLHLSHENVRVLSLRARRELKKKMEEDGYDFS